MACDWVNKCPCIPGFTQKGPLLFSSAKLSELTTWPPPSVKLILDPTLSANCTSRPSWDVHAHFLWHTRARHPSAMFYVTYAPEKVGTCAAKTKHINATFFWDPRYSSISLRAISPHTHSLYSHVLVRRAPSWNHHRIRIYNCINSPRIFETCA